MHLREVLFELTYAKLKEAIFIGPRIRKLMGYKDLEKKLSQLEFAAWCSFKDVIECFLEKQKTL